MISVEQLQLQHKIKEIKDIRAVCSRGKINTVKPTKVDLKLVSNNETIYLIDIKTAKPNAGAFKEFKRTLLEWIATTFADHPNAKVQTLIAIPYNPYEPKSYHRWTMQEFLDFLGGCGTYTELLDCFERAGFEL
ncbi:hypothetical protein AGMMS49974_05540 [Deltaproteobacteria bacterium]|nr:hypothetical protein AGMMS49974_05540 [Deltaproteobacteria bacterium]